MGTRLNFADNGSEMFKYRDELFSELGVTMGEIKIEISEGLLKLAGKELKKPEMKVLFREAVEEKLRTLLLFERVDAILQKSKLSEEQAQLLADELNKRVAKRHGLL
ncbi:MAG: hypothetical protein NT038_07315 [Euryarchaeota archaeon]|nr:hypothetical protein [Euryarchaeota archaeon]